MKAHLIAFDFETGGLDPLRNPILTGYFIALDKDLSKMGDLEIKVRPEEPFSLVEDGALAVNGINLQEHLADHNTLSRKEAGIKLLSFISQYSEGRSKPRPMGHNIVFDLGFLHQIIEKKDWDKHVNYGNIDTKVVSDFLKDAGILPQDIGNLGSLVKYFGINALKAHTAKDDVLMTIEVYSKLLSIVKPSGSGLNMDLISLLEK